MKHRGILKVSVYDREQRALVYQRHETHKTLENQRDGEKSVDSEAPQVQKEEFVDLHGAYSNDYDCEPHNPVVNKVDIRVKNIFTNHMVSKALLTNDKRVLVVKVITSQ